MSKAIGSEEINIKDLILLIQDYIKEFWKYKWLILLLGPLFGFLSFLKEKQEVNKYTSSLTFMLDDDSGASLGGISSLIGTLGFGGGGENNVDKMLMLMKSRAIIKKSIFSRVTVNGVDDFFANHIIRYQELEVYADEEETEIFYFTRSDFGKNDRLENEAMLAVYKSIVGSEGGSSLLKIERDELNGRISMKATFLNEELAVEYPIVLYNIVEDYFIKKTIEKSAKTYEIIKFKNDSILSLISSKEYQLAKEYDSSKNQLLLTNKIDRARLEKDIRILYEQYAEVVKNKELSEFSLLTLTPIVQAIDLPIYPVEPTEPRIIFALGIGGILGGLLAGFIIIVRKLYRDTMGAKDEELDFA